MAQHRRPVNTYAGYKMLKTPQKTSILLIGTAVIVFLISVIATIGYYPIWDRKQGVSACDIAVFAASISTFIQSIIGLLINNYIFLSHKKDWRDFWSRDMLEFFSIKSEDKLEPWRLARGRFIFYSLGVAVSFIMPIIYSARWVHN